MTADPRPVDGFPDELDDADVRGAVRFSIGTRVRIAAIWTIGGLLLIPLVLAVALPVWGWSPTLGGVAIGLAVTAVLAGGLQWLASGGPSLGWEPEGLRFRVDDITVVANWATLGATTWTKSRRFGAVEGIVVTHTRAYRRDGLTLDGRTLERLDRSGFDAFVPVSLFGGRGWRDGPVGAGVRAYRPDALA